MKKDAFYFSHDSNARNDLKILALRSVYGWEGYGKYWALIEMLRDEATLKLPLKGWLSHALAKEFDCSKSEIETFINDCINEFELFQSDDNFFWSESLTRRMSLANEKRQKLSEAGKKGYKTKKKKEENLSHPQATLEPPLSNKIKEKEIKEKEIKENNIISTTTEEITEEKKEFCEMVRSGGFISIYNCADKEIALLYDDLKRTYPLLDLKEVALKFKNKDKKSIRNHKMYITGICSSIISEQNNKTGVKEYEYAQCGANDSKKSGWTLNPDE